MSTTNCYHCFQTDVLGDLDGTELAQLIRNKSIKPQEAVEAAIQRAEQAQPHINAIVSSCYERAIKKSSRLNKSLFAGVPTFIKDNTPFKGLPTNHGSHAISAKPDWRHGPYAKQYLSQGFVVLGKSSLPEFGFNATTEPPNLPATRNPWNLDYSTGASSGGSAALVAAGVVPIAHANDGGGSIRIPAACCGLIGLKPSRGRHVLSSQSKPLPINILSDGIVSRSLRDTCHFHAEAEKYYRNRNLPEIGLVTHPGKTRLRIALVMHSITGYKTDKDTQAAVAKTAAYFESMGHLVEEVDLPIPQSFMEDFILYWSSLAFMTHKTGKIIMDRSFDERKLDGLTLGLSQHYRNNYLKTPQFLYRLKKVAIDYENFFKQYDVALTPVLAHTTPKLGHISPEVPFEELIERLTRYVSFTPLANVTGAPAISLPISVTDSHLPVSIQLSTGIGREKTLLELSHELNEAHPWPQIRD